MTWAEEVSPFQKLVFQSNSAKNDQLLGTAKNN